MFKKEYFKLKELGQVFGTTNQEVGLWLKELGYRSEGEQRPTSKAFDEGLVGEVAYEGHYQWLWHAERSTKVLEDAGHYRIINPPVHLVAPPTLVGPFSVRKIGDGTFQIVSSNGAVAAIVSGEFNAKQLKKVMEAGFRLGMFSNTKSETS